MIQDRKNEPVYGAGVLRLWAATVDYTKDMSIGQKVLAQTSESMRRLRNSARFMLGNIATTKVFDPVARSEMGLV